MSSFDALLEAMAPGASQATAPDFPRSLGLQPLGVLGEGGESVVYRAHDPVLDREVAVKVSRPEAPAAAREALLTEAQRQGRVRHPGVLPVHGVEVAEGRVCVVMELAPNRTLLDWMRDPPQQDRAAAVGALVHGIASALEAAHEVGVVHGDLHPRNVVLGSGTAPRVLDWMGHRERPGEVTGDPVWLAPERLRGEPATTASDVYSLGALLVALFHGTPHRPRAVDQSLGAFLAEWSERVPAWDPLPDEWQAWAVACLAFDPEERPTVQACRAGFADWISGAEQRRRRHRDARVLLEQGRASLERFRRLVDRLRDERTVVTVQRTKVVPHAPVEQKRSLWDAEARVEALVAERARTWLEAVDTVTRGRSLLDDEREEAVQADRLLARLWWERGRDCAIQGLPLEERVAVERARALDDGTLFRAVESPAQLCVEVTVPGATVRIGRVETNGRIWAVETWQKVQVSKPVSVSPGSWRIEVRAEGYRDTVVPVVVGAQEQRTLEVTLWSDAAIGPEWVYIPAGRFFLGGDPRARQPLDRCQPTVADRFMTRTCITTREWKAFLDALDPELAKTHVPSETGLFGGSRPLWSHQADGWQPPEGWSLDWPVVLVSVPDIEAYAAWRSEQEGRVCRLPTEEEWEKAARGVDGRPYPWGRGFDPTYAHMRQSQPGSPQPAAVGSYPVDQSVFGCMDMAGGVREFTASQFDEGQRVVRGGTWGDDADDLRCANRAGLQPGFRMAFVGFRLITEQPRAAAPQQP